MANNRKEAQRPQKYYFDRKNFFKANPKVGDIVQKIHIPKPGENWHQSGRDISRSPDFWINGVVELQDSFGRTENLSLLSERADRQPVTLTPLTSESQDRELEIGDDIFLPPLQNMR